MSTTKQAEPATNAPKFIVLRNKTIIDFYDQHKLDPTTMNLLFIDIMKNLSINLNNSVNATVNNKILDIVTGLSTSVTEISQSVNRLNSDFMLRLHDSKREYIDEIKAVVTNSTSLTSEKVQMSIDKSNDTLLAKTSLIINDIIPRNNEKTSAQLNDMIQNLCKNVTAETSKIVEICKKDESNIHNVSELLETKINNMIGLVQQPIFNIISSNQESNRNQLDDLKLKIHDQKETQNCIFNELKVFLNQYKHTAAVKGSVAEFQLMQILQNLLPSDDIQDVSDQDETGDIMVTRHDVTKPKILFESKDYNKTVDTKEVAKFQRDVQKQRTHGIFVSQKSGITFKKPFEINVINGLLHVYVPNCDYNSEKIQIAIDIVDSFHAQLQKLDKGPTDISLTNEQFLDIVREYNEFVAIKSLATQQLEDSIKEVRKSIDKIQIPSIKKWFINNGALNKDSEFLCPFCLKFEGINQASLGQHKRNCSARSSTSAAATESTIESVDLCENAAVATEETSDNVKTKTKKGTKSKPIRV